MFIITTSKNEVIYYKHQITSNAYQQSMGRLKKKRGLHYNTKIIITESNNQVLGELHLRKTEGN